MRRHRSEEEIPMTVDPFRRRACGAALAAALAPATALRAQPAFPSRPITLVVPYTAGGASDFGARLLAPEIGKRLGQQVIVENVGGAGGALGVQRVVRAAADGHTMLYGSLGETVMVPTVNRSVNYVPEDLLPVALAAKTPVAFIVRPDFEAGSMDELIALARRRPGALTYGSPGIGTFQHVMTETVKARTGTFIVHIPYRGGQNLVNDVLAGQIDIGVTSAPNVAPLLASKRVKALAVSSASRLDALPGVPSFSETAALKGMDLQTWGMLFVPKGTPAAIVARLNAVANEVSQLPTIVATRAKTGSVLPRPLGAAESAAFFAAEIATYRPIASRIKPE
jgi:tripartite-type tricarboxylate transporter receptor subunit TctC